ncbi:uncharacterized protein LOC136036343 isoform X2 [Artemia franciscana]|uniref:uncharacterized protein LOC136036343 isoform X2 n=1 Tax=Artemia franciscana TaxID=6661 RepID=UPI0032DBB76C
MIMQVNINIQGPKPRLKRVSDQRLAELETLFDLAKIRSRFVNFPVGMGLIDPGKTGKRKRSSDFLIITDDEETISKDNIEAVPRRSHIEGDIEKDDPVLIMSVSDLSKIIRSSRKRNINRY